MRDCSRKNMLLRKLNYQLTLKRSDLFKIELSSIYSEKNDIRWGWLGLEVYCWLTFWPFSLVSWRWSESRFQAVVIAICFSVCVSAAHLFISRVNSSVIGLSARWELKAFSNLKVNLLILFIGVFILLSGWEENVLIWFSFMV